MFFLYVHVLLNGGAERRPRSLLVTEKAEVPSLPLVRSRGKTGKTRAKNRGDETVSRRVGKEGEKFGERFVSRKTGMCHWIDMRETTPLVNVVDNVFYEYILFDRIATVYFVRGKRLCL